ncbi:MAG: hypothetical protein KDE11_12290 [Rhodobacteraceae bacterium]|nr:hypothetical protein [Paracoccaceae bacterium]
MKAIVHIGCHKTGTTAIQTWLGINRAALSAQGFRYDRFDGKGWASPTNQGQFVIALFTRFGKPIGAADFNRSHAIRDMESQIAIARKFESDLGAAIRADGDTYLISCEHLSTWAGGAGGIGILDAWLSSLFCEVRYVMYLRRPDIWLASRYSQGVKDGTLTVSLAEYIRQHKHCRYGRLVSGWARGVGRDRFDLRIFDETWLQDDGLIDDFAAAIGADPRGMKPPGRRNLSVTAAEAETALRRNRGHAAPLQAALWPRALRWLRNRWSAPQKLALSAEQTAEIWQANAAGVAWVHRNFFPGRAALFGFAEPPRAVYESPVDKAAPAAARPDRRRAPGLQALRTGLQALRK